MDNDILTNIEKSMDDDNFISFIENGMIVIKSPSFVNDSIKGIIMTQDETYILGENGKRFIIK